MELVQEDAYEKDPTAWQAIRLITNGCTGTSFRKLSKDIVAKKEQLDLLCTRQPSKVSLYRKEAAVALNETTIGEFLSDA